MDAITMLKDDHQSVEKLFKEFEKAGDRAFVTKRKLVDRMIEELSRHAAIEEQIFYPATRETIDGIDDQVLEGIEEHHIVKWQLSELEQLDVEDERFDAKVTVLIENVRHHVEEEEGDYFPKVRDAWGRNDLQDLAHQFVEPRANPRIQFGHGGQRGARRVRVVGQIQRELLVGHKPRLPIDRPDDVRE